MLNTTILANKWRPKTFTEMIEQDHIVTAMKNILVSKNIHHSYIFYGPKGTGKTTLARLFSKGLLCMQGVTDNPCQICSNCKEIDIGNCLDFIEIDGASHTKVEEIRNLLVNLPYLPNKSKYKIYLIDEFHMLSKHSFNALLKTLEEPPLHIKFLLSTTEITKIPSTILSRSIQFNFQLISNKAILKQLKNILFNENIKMTLPALHLISHEAKGSLRDAITLTEHAILLIRNKYEPINICYINKILGRINPQKIICCLKALLEKNIIKLFHMIYIFESQHNINWQQFYTELIIITQKLLLIKIVKDTKNNLISILLGKDIILSDIQKNQLIKIAESSKYSNLKLVYKILLIYRNEFNINLVNPRFIIERVFLNILL